jgi:hypothetical protein
MQRFATNERLMLFAPPKADHLYQTPPLRDIGHGYILFYGIVRIYD